MNKAAEQYRIFQDASHPYISAEFRHQNDDRLVVWRWDAMLAITTPQYKLHIGRNGVKLQSFVGRHYLFEKPPFSDN